MRPASKTECLIESWHCLVCSISNLETLQLKSWTVLNYNQKCIRGSPGEGTLKDIAKGSPGEAMKIKDIANGPL